MSFSWAMEASSSSSTPPQQKYDVFLSFHGKDTRKSFTDHLFAALKVRGIVTFRDDVNLNRGENIKLELPKAIEESRISLVVFSKNYTESEWCMEELVKMMECSKRSHQQHIILPIFYDVKASDVRAQKGSVADSLAKHQNCGRNVEKWKETLHEFANLSGFDLQDSFSGHEAMFIQKIVEEVEMKLNHASLRVVNHPVRIETHLDRLMKLLDMETDDNRIVVIWGIGGIGKTELAIAAYNLIHRDFEGSSFVANVRETSNQPNGMVLLQKQILSDILKIECHNIGNVHQGSELIKRRVLGQKVLLVLDDVDSAQQLKELAIDRNFLSRGSKIIITTRVRSSVYPFEPDEVFELVELNEDESLELFSWHAFKQYKPKEDYLELSGMVVSYIRGIPLALEVIGSFLFKKDIPEWRSAIEELKKFPNDDVQKRLRISFDSLSQKRKALFLDIACFFVGRSQDFTIKILEGCELYPVIGIQELVDWCLIKIDASSNLMMHDLLRDMGREIVREESFEEPGERSRVWDHNDALRVLIDSTGTKKVEGVFLNFSKPRDVHVNAKAFEEMVRLRLLNLDYVRLSGVGCELIISSRLVWLSWKGLPLKCMPTLTVEKLIALDLSHSSLKHVWKGIKILDKLRFLNLSHCNCLTKTPDFSGLSNLEELLLNDCLRLVEVHDSIKSLHKLIVLDLKNCKNLRKLPSGVWMLTSLKSLDLSGCSNLGIFAGLKGTPSTSWYSFFSSLMRGTPSASWYSSFSSLMQGSPPSMSWYSSFSSLMQPRTLNSIDFSLASNQSLCLEKLCLADCNLSHVPNEIGCLTPLRELDLSGNNFHVLPETIFDLPYLENLFLDRCARLQSLISYKASSDLDKIDKIWALDCTSLTSISRESGDVRCGHHCIWSFLKWARSSHYGKELLRGQEEPYAIRNDIFYNGNEVYTLYHPDIGLGLHLSIAFCEKTRQISCTIVEFSMEGHFLTDANDRVLMNHFRLIWLMIPLSGLEHPQVLWHRREPDSFSVMKIKCSDALEIILARKPGPSTFLWWTKSIDEVEEEEKREEVVKFLLQADWKCIRVIRYNRDLLPENTNRLLCLMFYTY